MKRPKRSTSILLFEMGHVPIRKIWLSKTFASRQALEILLHGVVPMLHVSNN